MGKKPNAYVNVTFFFVNLFLTHGTYMHNARNKRYAYAQSLQFLPLIQEFSESSINILKWTC